MDLVELLEIAEQERARRKPVRIRCCQAGSCLFSNAQAVKARLEGVRVPRIGFQLQKGNLIPPPFIGALCFLVKPGRLL